MPALRKADESGITRWPSTISRIWESARQRTCAAAGGATDRMQIKSADRIVVFMMRFVAHVG